MENDPSIILVYSELAYLSAHGTPSPIGTNWRSIIPSQKFEVYSCLSKFLLRLAKPANRYQLVVKSAFYDLLGKLNQGIISGFLSKITPTKMD